MQAEDFMPGDAEIARIGKDIEAYEAERSAASRSVRLRLIGYLGGLGVVVFLLALAFNVFADPSETWLSAPHVFLYFAGVAGAILLWRQATKPARGVQQAFRDKVLPAIFGFIKDLRYRNGATPDTFDRLPGEAIGLFDRERFDDVISGRYEDFAFELYEARLSRISGKSRKTVFRGVVMAFEMEQVFPGLLLATRKANVVGRLFRDVFGGGGLEELTSGVESLDETYDFRSDNPAAARPLVTGRLARALQWLGEAWPDAPARVALAGKDGFLLLPQTKDFFELPDIDSPVSYEKHLRTIIADMASLLATGALVRKVGGADDTPNETAKTG
jgi:hypothetical protein